ncbi:MAG: chloride channel protein [Paramuribaculum sp.]|nr:chloride channel protein [Paramuribaculum sp.]
MTPPQQSTSSRKETSFFSRTIRLTRRRIPERPLIFILSALVGCAAGVMAWGMKSSIGFISKLITRGFNATQPDLWLLAAPPAGVLIVVFLRRFFLHGDISHGVRVISKKIKNHDPYIPPQVTYSPIIATVLTLGFGGSAGAEGPIAFSGGALGSNTARAFGLNRQTVMLMMGCGAGAGIAAIFKAPIGGALFTLEVLRMGLGAFGVMVLFVSTLIAGLTATALEGFSLEMVMRQVTAYDPHILPWVIALGLFCGVYSLFYSYIMKLIENLLDKMTNRWIKGGLSGLLVGVALVVFPSLYGEGYPVMGAILNGNFSRIIAGTPFASGPTTAQTLLLTAAGILAVKGFVTSLSYNGGGVTGEFAPTLFAGCFAGLVFGEICNLASGSHLPVQQMAFFAMAGVMAGAIRAPMMAIFIVVEMSSAYTLILPVAITAGISFGIVRLFTADSFFARRMDRNNGLASRFKKAIRDRGGKLL